MSAWRKLAEGKAIFILWLISFVLHLAVINHFVGWICTDTTGYWLHAATFTGHDWSEVARNASKYYSWGYSLLLMIPFILSPRNMIVMSRIAIAINALLCSLTVPLLYGIGRRILKDTDKKTILICAFATSCYSTYFLETSVALSESLLFFLYVLLIWLTVRYLSEKRIRWAISCSICCCYMYIVHHRTLGIIIAFCVMLLIMYLYDRDKRTLLSFLIPFLACFIIGRFVESWLMEKETMAGLYKGNTYYAMFQKMPKILSIEGILLSIQNVVGAVWYILIGTFATAALGIISVVEKIVSLISNGRKEERGKELSLNIFLIFSLLFSMGISVITTVRTGYSDERMDLIFYGRYFENALSLFIFFGFNEMIRLRKNKEWLKKIILLVLAMIITSTAVYFFTQMVNGNMINCFSVTAVLMLYSFPNFEFSILPISILAVLIVVLMMYLCWMGKHYRIMAYALITGCFLYTGYNAVVNVDNASKFYANVSGYPTQNEEAVCINEYINENEIGFFGVYGADGYEAFSYQLMHPEKKVYSISALDEIEDIKEDISHVIVPLYLKEEMKVGELELETANYAIYEMASKDGL